MSRSAAVKRYLSHYLERGLPSPPANKQWSHCIVIPVYQESPNVLQAWIEQHFAAIDLLVIFVINRPDGSDANANQAFRDATQTQTFVSCSEHINLLPSKRHNDILILDLDSLHGALPKSEGVGLARKTGCDLALLWQTAGNIETPVLYSTDADARLPEDYFQRITIDTSKAAIFTFPFSHVAAGEPEIYEATLWYEMWLHHYVLGLEFAGSPYAYHSLGSCLAISSECYAQVGGFPKRAGGEDFYLLNKANKTSSVVCLRGEPIKLQARRSSRVPFGTGPGVQKILDAHTTNGANVYYHPQCFAALRAWLRVMPTLYRQGDTGCIEALLEEQQLPKPLANASVAALNDLGIVKAFAHCSAQGKTPQQFTKQFHQWFDGFRTLKFVHALRANSWADLPFEDMLDCEPSLWPSEAAHAQNAATLQKVIQQHWHWN